jgi:hypothetical protein
LGLSPLWTTRTHGVHGRRRRVVKCSILGKSLK